MVATSLLLLGLASQGFAFPWVAGLEGVDSSLLKKSPNVVRQSSTCPNNPNHQGAVPYNAAYPYCGARGGKTPAVFPCKNNLVPAPGDTAHRFIAPGPLDIRGPCPGINVAANHGFLSRDGITTYDELVEMQQNVYGVGYDLAHLLATLGVGLDGDYITGKLSIGCDATSRTASLPTSQSGQFGLNGHNKFEGDASLTRNDYFTAGGDNFRFNQTLYDDMINNYCQGNCGLQQLGKYRGHRWEVSKGMNGNFMFSPLSILLYGAASFLYELFPSRGPAGPADTATMNSFFIDEKLPENWFSRENPYTIPLVSSQIRAMYFIDPKPFGFNTGKPNTYVGAGLSGPYSDGALGTPQGFQCALYLLATGLIPGVFLQNPMMSTGASAWAVTNLLPFFSAANANGELSGCPFGPHSPGSPL